MGKKNDYPTIHRLQDLLRFFEERTGIKARQITLPVAIYHNLVKDLHRLYSGGEPLEFAASYEFEFEGCWVRRCTPKGVYLNAAGQNEEVNEELRIS